MSNYDATLFNRAQLGIVLAMIKQCDTDYERRYPLVLCALASAASIGYPAGFRIDPAEPEWPVAYIELPTGQVSWHMPQHLREWDGHSTEEKYERCGEFGRRILDAMLPTSQPEPRTD